MNPPSPIAVKRPLSFVIFCLMVISLFATGCSTFKYTPKHDQTYSPVTEQTGLAIKTGHDLRPPEEVRPAWTKNAESIVAHALADEIKYARLFHRVKLHADSPNLKKYSQLVQFKVLKFECYNHPAFLESTGRELMRFQGLRGALIAESIPSKYISEVQVEFEVADAATQQTVFTKTYSASRSSNLNGYQGSHPKVAQTSTALESVITQFVADLVKLPAE